MLNLLTYNFGMKNNFEQGGIVPLRSKVKIKYAKKYIFSHIIMHNVQVYYSNWFKTRILLKSGSQFSIKIAKDHLQVKGQGHQLDAGIKIGFDPAVQLGYFATRDLLGGGGG